MAESSEERSGEGPEQYLFSFSESVVPTRPRTSAAEADFFFCFPQA
jgi:hypothetical protein